MDVILHIGAHRCATTTFQYYMRHNADRLAADGTGFWGTHRTRNGLFRGILPGPAEAFSGDRGRRAAGRVALNLERSRTRGVRRLIVSEENMMGSVRRNLRAGTLYGDVGERMARFAAAFGGRVTGIALNLRSPELYWASALGFAAARGCPIPDAERIAALAEQPRGWREVVGDIACAMPGTPIRVLPFEVFAGRPDAQLAVITGRPAPAGHAREWLNATPRQGALRALCPDLGPGGSDSADRRWFPFTPAQAAHLREVYADDMMWLRAGADGLARLAMTPKQEPAGKTPPTPDLTRGRRDDRYQRLAGAG